MHSVGLQQNIQFASTKKKEIGYFNSSVKFAYSIEYQ